MDITTRNANQELVTSLFTNKAMPWLYYNEFEI